MKENETKGMTRRTSLKALGSGLALGLTATNYRALAGESPNEKLRFAAIGVGGMGTGRLNQFMQLGAQAVAICDVDDNHLRRSLDNAEKRQGTRPKGFHDFREVLQLGDIDFVTVTTPDHWHAPIFIAACEAGKDVFVEKPLCHNIGDGVAMVAAAKKYQRITQMGNHIHNDNNTYRRAVEMAQSGRLGKITRIHCWKSGRANSIGNPPDGDSPKELDYNFWQGPAPKRPYNPNRSHFNFRYFWDYSGGMLMDFWCHITDVAYWAMNLQAPNTVYAVGQPPDLGDNAETPERMELVYEYPGLILNWTIHPAGLAGFPGGIGCVFQGTDATMVTDYDKNVIYVKGRIDENFPRPEPTIPNSPGHLQEFLNSIKSREKTTCNVEYAFKLTKGGLLGNISYRTGEKLIWDDQRERVTNSSKANRLVKRRPRSPWKLT